MPDTETQTEKAAPDVHEGADQSPRKQRWRLVQWLWFDYDPSVDWGIPKLIGNQPSFRDLAPYEIQLKQCPTLSKLDIERPGFTKNIIQRAHRMRWWGYFAILAIALLAVVIVYVANQIFAAVNDDQEPIWKILIGLWPLFLLCVCVSATLAAYAVYRTRLAMQQALITELFRLCVVLEKNPAQWGRPQFTRSINRRLEACARQTEALPLILGLGGDPATRGKIAGAATGAAFQFRAYKVWVAQPGPFTFTDLVSALVGSLQLVHEGRWFELPKSIVAESNRASKLARLGWILLFIILLGLLLALGYAQTQIGITVSTIGATILGILLTFILTRLGVKIAALQQVAEVSASVFPTNKS